MTRSSSPYMLSEAQTYSIIEGLLGEGRELSRGEYTFFCPFCNHRKQKLQVNLKTGHFHCWICDRTLGTRGRSLAGLARRLKAPQAIVESLRKEGESNASVYQDSAPSLSLPPEFIPLAHPSKSLYRNRALNYLQSRGLVASDIIRYNIGYCEDGEFRHRIVIPSYDRNGAINFYQGRSYLDNEGIKYHGPAVPKGCVGFEWYISWDYPVVLCEGVFDAIAIRRNALPLFGKSLTPTVLSAISCYQPPRVYVCLDSDAMEDSVISAEMLYSEGIPTSIVELKADPSDLGFLAVTEAIKETLPLSFSDLVRYKLQLGV